MRIEILTSAKALYEQIARTAKKSFIEIDTCLSIACGGLVHANIIGIADSRYEAHILHPTTPRYKVLIVSDNMSADDLFTVVDFPDDPDLSKDGRRHLATHALRLMSISYDDLFVP